MSRACLRLGRLWPFTLPASAPAGNLGLDNHGPLISSAAASASSGLVAAAVGYRNAKVRKLP
jgi:hypothetical protein